MINNKRMARIRRELKKAKGKPVIIVFEDGSELEVTPEVVNDSFVRYTEDRDFIKVIKGKEIVSCSSLGMLVSIIKQLVEHGSEGETE